MRTTLVTFALLVCMVVASQETPGPTQRERVVLDNPEVVSLRNVKCRRCNHRTHVDG
ncbi:MAG TPA: hypothetical protein VJU84_09660 [Pyrinomonadaceae bacterium]|nr:hypothetical protein [Pyrinomonadaceae bacterium]